MKSYFFSVLMLIGMTVSAQVLDNIKASRTLPNNDNDELHRIANEFSDQVGEKLKEYYPAKVTNLRVNLHYNNGQFTLSYYASIVRAKESEHDYYFDHRGSLSIVGSKFEAIRNAGVRCNQQISHALLGFQKYYGSGKAMAGFSDDTDCGDGCYAAIAESFIVARKNK